MTEARVKKLIGAEAREEDVLLNFSAPVRAAYQHLISLIYDCSNNRTVAGALVDKILNRLSRESKAAKGTRRSATLKLQKNKKDEEVTDTRTT